MMAVLRVKPFLFLWFGQVFSQLAINMANFILLIRIGQVTHSNTATAFFVLSIGIPALLFGSLAGVYVDRWSKKRVLTICNFLRAILILIFFISSESLGLVYLFSFLISTVTQFFVPAEAPTIPKVVSGNLLLSANSLFTLTLYVSVIIGYMLAGPLLVLFGSQNVFLFVSLLFLIAGVFVSLLPKEEVRAETNYTNLSFHKRNIAMVLADFKEGYHYLVGNSVILSAFLLLTLSQVLISTIASLAPGFAREVMNVDIASISLVVIGPAALGMIIGSVLVASLGACLSKTKLINLGIWGAGIFLTLLSFTSRAQKHHQVWLNIIGTNNLLWLSMGFLFFLGIANSLVTVCANTTLQEKVTERIRGRIYGFLTAFGGFFSIFPVLLAGILSDYFGVVKVLFATGVGIISYGFFRFARKES